MNDPSLQDLPEYQNFLEQALQQINQARIKTAKSVNKELILLYW